MTRYDFQRGSEVIFRFTRLRRMHIEAARMVLREGKSKRATARLWDVDRRTVQRACARMLWAVQVCPQCGRDGYRD